MKNLRTIFKGMAAAAVITVAMSGCNHKAPFQRLEAAVDSTQMEIAEHAQEGMPKVAVIYDELTNTVVYTFDITADLSQPEVEQNFKAQFPVMEAGIVQNLLINDKYNLGKEIVCAGSNLKIELKGTLGGNLETTIDNSKILEAYDAVFGEGKAAELRASQND